MLKKIVALTLTLAMVFSLVAVSGVAVVAETSEKKPNTAMELIKQKGFINGIQQCWQRSDSVGNCIGASRGAYPRAANFEPDLWEELFVNSKAMGFDCVKTWLTYQWGGIEWDAEGHIVGTSEDYLTNLRTILEIAKKHDMYFSPTIIAHSEYSALDDEKGKYKFDLRSRFIYDPDITDEFIENWLTPVVKLLSEYDNVILIDIFCEPEANGGMWDILGGTNWEQMRYFIKTVSTAVKEICPRFETYCSGMIKAAELWKYYGDLNLDFYGNDLYTTNGTVPDTSELFLEKPFIFGEYGNNSDNTSESFKSNFVFSYLNNCIELGVKAAFWWHYGWPAASSTQYFTGDEQGRLNSSALAVRSWTLGREYEKTGYEGMDMPAMMYTTGEKVRFMGSRGATKYVLQRKEGDADWIQLAEMGADGASEYEYNAMLFEYPDTTVEQTHTYQYRVIAYDDEGSSLTSEPTKDIYIKRKTCDDADNLLTNHSFEENIFDGPGKAYGMDMGVWNWSEQSGENPSQPTLRVHKDDATEATGPVVHDGEYSMYNISRVWQDVTVKPYTNYTFTFYYRQNEIPSYWYGFAAAVIYDWDKTLSQASYNGFDQKLMFPLFHTPVANANNQWQYYTITFNSAENTELRISFHYWWAPDMVSYNNYYYYLDDVYFFEAD